jgi:ornithine decarboxylase antizyme 1
MKNQKKSNIFFIFHNQLKYLILLVFFFKSNRFVSLLEFADDTLHCKHVIVYFDKTRPDRAALVKTFMFLGFHILSPDNILMKNNDKDQDQLYMVYIIDSDG